MTLDIFIDSEDAALKKKYEDAVLAHNGKLLIGEYMDAGFDLYAPDEIACVGGSVNKIDFRIKCAAKMEVATEKFYNTGFYMYPRSSLSKTPLRLANSVGIIDSGYRGNLIGMFDCNDSAGYNVVRYDRLAQICAPSLAPIYVNLVNSVSELGLTERGDGGFGSTGR